jgi:GT2 family glycosyltransferase
MRDVPVKECGVDVVIVHYNTPLHLHRCLVSLFSTPFDRLRRVVVIDNASRDRSVEGMTQEFPGVQFRFNDQNQGFATACNEGIRVTKAAYCLLLNPDTLITAPAIATLLRFMENHANAGIVAPQMLNADGSLQLSCRRFPKLLPVLLRATRMASLAPGPVDQYLMRDWDHTQGGPVDWVIGACMLLRRTAVESEGLLDERFFLYYEDTDLCRRLSASGWGVHYEPAALVRHEHRRESASLFPGRAARAHFCSLFRLFRKHRFALW